LIAVARLGEVPVAGEALGGIPGVEAGDGDTLDETSVLSPCVNMSNNATTAQARAISRTAKYLRFMDSAGFVGIQAIGYRTLLTAGYSG
jgi:hypothetical protein